MFTAPALDAASKTERYRELNTALAALLTGEPDPLANAANTAALIYMLVPGLNWAGFYFLRGAELVLGPFQGKPACTRIALGAGVCGTAAARRQPILVEDVHAFPGHIACDHASASELVIPLLQGETLLGVLDLDSPHQAHFTAADQTALQQTAAIYLAACDLSKI